MLTTYPSPAPFAQPLEIDVTEEEEPRPQESDADLSADDDSPIEDAPAPLAGDKPPAPATGPTRPPVKAAAKAAARPPAKGSARTPPPKIVAKGPAKAPAKAAPKVTIAAKPGVADAESDGDGGVRKGSSQANLANRERRAKEIERRKAEAAAAAARTRKVRLVSTGSVILTVVVIIGAIFLFRGKAPVIAAPPTTPLTTTETASYSPAPSFAPSPSAERVPIPTGPVLADTSSMAQGQTVNGVQCETSEALQYHIHTHLSVFVNGVGRQIPQFIGITTKCLYWLHTHAPDGILHVESPTSRVYTLGDFFKVWGQPLDAAHVGPITGQVTAFVNGQRFTGSDPSTIPLRPHDELQLDVGTPTVAPVTVTFGSVQ